MQIRYTLKKRDILFGRMSLMIRSKPLLAFSILVICLLTFAVSSGPEYAKASIGFHIFCTIFAFGFSTVFYLASQLIINFFIILFSKNAGLLGAHTLEIRDDGLEESTDVNKSLLKWNPTFRAGDSFNYVWILPTDNQLYMIPKRAGACEGDLPSFLSQLKIKIAAAKTSKS